MAEYNLGHVVGRQGDKGDTGDTGNGISKIELVSTVGLVKTYRITFTNDDYFEFVVTDGSSGVGSYNVLTDKPQINSVELVGDKNLNDLGVQEVIHDLGVIRSGAYLGATALQNGDNVSELVNDEDYVSKDFVKWYFKQPLTLSSSSDTPFVMSGESFTVSATLHNNSGVGISGETITLTGSDTHAYSAITDNTGVATFNISSITSDVTYGSEYEDLTSNTTVEHVLIHDKGTIAKHNDRFWTNLTGITRTENYTQVVNAKSTGNIINGSCSIKFYYYYDDSIVQNRIRIGYKGDSTTGKFTNIDLHETRYGHDSGEVELRYLEDTGELEIYFNGELKRTLTGLSFDSPYPLEIVQQNPYFRYKNMRIKEL